METIPLLQVWASCSTVKGPTTASQEAAYNRLKDRIKSSVTLVGISVSRKA